MMTGEKRSTVKKNNLGVDLICLAGFVISTESEELQSQHKC
jgi:hypothetical protein